MRADWKSWMPTWLKFWLIAAVVVHTAVAVVDGRRCAGGDRTACAAACGECGPCIASQPPGDQTRLADFESACCDEGCGEAGTEGSGCPTWACLLCRCDDRAPPARERVPSEPKHPSPVKPAFIERAVYHESMLPLLATVLPRVSPSPPERLAVLCIWRL